MCVLGVFPARSRCQNHPLPTLGWCRGLGLCQPSGAAGGIEERSIQTLIFNLSYCLLQKVSLLGVFRAEGWKQGICGCFFWRALVLAEVAEHHCGGCCRGWHRRGDPCSTAAAPGTGLCPTSPGGTAGLSQLLQHVLKYLLPVDGFIHSCYRSDTFKQCQ